MHYNGYLAELSNNISDVEVRQKQIYLDILFHLLISTPPSQRSYECTDQ